jgi:hypothetical protein
MKRLLPFIIFLLMINPLFASNASEEDVSNAFVAITDLGFVAVSNFISLNRADFDSIAVRVSEKNSLPEALLINEADLSDYLPYFKEDKQTFSFLSSFLPSIDPLVKERLEINNWKKGEAIVTGAGTIIFPNDFSLQNLLSDTSQLFSTKIGLSFNFYVDGSLFKEKINIKGIIIVSSDSYGVPIITPIKLDINQENYDLKFFEKAPLLLTMKNDI